MWFTFEIGNLFALMGYLHKISIEPFKGVIDFFFGVLVLFSIFGLEA
jgi:hypothetical protein